MEDAIVNAIKIDDFQKSVIEDNYKTLIGILETSIIEPKRLKALMKLYKDYEEQIKFAPASGKLNFHNAFVGGYLDHVLRVEKLAQQMADMMETNGGAIDCTREEITFAAIHHDLGKLGMPGQPYYRIQDDEWRQKKMMEVFTNNDTGQYMKVLDITLYLLQLYGIQYTQNEMLGIRLADGMYDEANSPYLKDRKGDFPIRTNIIYLIHWADHMASRIEHDKIRLKYTK